MPTGYSKETGENPFKGKTRKPFTEEHRRKMSEAKKGKQSPNKGKSGLKKHSQETIQRMRNSHRKGTDHWFWKGDSVGYHAVHSWVERNLGMAKDHKCRLCDKDKNLQWSNKNHFYRRILDEWWVLCAKCHANYDRIVLKIETRWTKREKKLQRL